MLHQIDLRHLTCFISAVECGSISHAALVQDLSQPTFSTRIRQLETAVGARLFHRNGRGVEATSAGRALFERIKPLVGDLHAALIEVGAVDGMYQGEVVVGIVPTVAGKLSIPLAKIGAAPQVKVRVVESFSGHLQGWLLNGDIDMAVCTSMPKRRDIQQTLIRAEPLLLVGRQGKGPVREQVGFRSLQEVPLVLGSPVHAIRQILDQTARRQNVRLSVAHEVDSLDAQLRFVRQGLGYAILPAGALDGEAHREEFWTWPIADPSIYRHLVVAMLHTTVARKPAVASVANRVAQLLGGTLLD